MDSSTVASDGHGGSEVVVPGYALAAYDADGRRLWSYRPAAAEGKTTTYSDVAVDGEGNLVSLDSATGVQCWAEQPNDLVAGWAVQRGGVFASPDIPGADGHGVAVASGTVLRLVGVALPTGRGW